MKKVHLFPDECNATKAKLAEVTKKYNECLEREKELGGHVELYPKSGVYLKRDKLNQYVNCAPTFYILARTLFRHFFSLSELKTHSLFGIKCRANLNNSNNDEEPLPEINPKIRNAVFGEWFFFIDWKKNMQNERFHIEYILIFLITAFVMDKAGYASLPKGMDRKYKSDRSAFKGKLTKSLTDFLRETRKKPIEDDETEEDVQDQEDQEAQILLWL